MTVIKKAIKPKARATPFQQSYLINYGLQVVERDSNTQRIQAVKCQFCVYFDRILVNFDARQRKATENVKRWNAPWRAELFSSHHESQHLSK